MLTTVNGMLASYRNTPALLIVSHSQGSSLMFNCFCFWSGFWSSDERWLNIKMTWQRATHCVNMTMEMAFCYTCIRKFALQSPPSWKMNTYSSLRQHSSCSMCQICHTESKKLWRKSKWVKHRINVSQIWLVLRLCRLTSLVSTLFLPLWVTSAFMICVLHYFSIVSHGCIRGGLEINQCNVMITCVHYEQSPNYTVPIWSVSWPQLQFAITT